MCQNLRNIYKVQQRVNNIRKDRYNSKYYNHQDKKGKKYQHVSYYP